MTAVGQGVSVEQRAGRGGAVVLGETAGQDQGGVGEVVPLKGVAVAAAAFGSAGGASTVDVGDTGVAEPDEVIDGLAEPGRVVGANDIDSAVPHRAGDDDDGLSGGEVGR